MYMADTLFMMMVVFTTGMVVLGSIGWLIVKGIEKLYDSYNTYEFVREDHSGEEL